MSLPADVARIKLFPCSASPGLSKLWRFGVFGLRMEAWGHSTLRVLGVLLEDSEWRNMCGEKWQHQISSIIFRHLSFLSTRKGVISGMPDEETEGQPDLPEQGLAE